MSASTLSRLLCAAIAAGLVLASPPRAYPEFSYPTLFASSRPRAVGAKSLEIMGGGLLADEDSAPVPLFAFEPELRGVHVMSVSCKVRSKVTMRCLVPIFQVGFSPLPAEHVGKPLRAQASVGPLRSEWAQVATIVAPPRVTANATAEIPAGARHMMILGSGFNPDRRGNTIRFLPSGNLSIPVTGFVFRAGAPTPAPLNTSEPAALPSLSDAAHPPGDTANDDAPRNPELAQLLRQSRLQARGADTGVTSLLVIFQQPPTEEQLGELRAIVHANGVDSAPEVVGRVVPASSLGSFADGKDHSVDDALRSSVALVHGRKARRTRPREALLINPNSHEYATALRQQPGLGSLAEHLDQHHGLTVLIVLLLLAACGFLCCCAARLDARRGEDELGAMRSVAKATDDL